MNATGNTVGVGEYWGVGHRNRFLPAAAAGVPASGPFADADELTSTPACAPRPHRALMGWARSVGAALGTHVATDPGARRAYRLAAGALARVRETQVSLVEDHLTGGDGTRTAPHHLWLRRLAADALEAAAA